MIEIHVFVASLGLSLTLLARLSNSSAWRWDPKAVSIKYTKGLAGSKRIAERHVLNPDSLPACGNFVPWG